MNRTRTTSTQNATLNLPVFEGYPYLVVRLQSAFYHLTVLPADYQVQKLRELARWQAQTNDLETSLALGPDCCFYYRTDGSECEYNRCPQGGTVVSGILGCAEVFPLTPELTERRLHLESFVNSLRKDGYVFGDLKKGGRKPNAIEARSLRGRQPNGVPGGLSQCPKCHEWRGECFDPNPQMAGLIVRTHCVCENSNRCALCGQLLCERKVNANYYNEDDQNVWHVPGFCALRHRCDRGPKRQC